MTFDWDPDKNRSNYAKHGVDFYTAQEAFLDPDRVLAMDVKHSDEKEKRYFCFGKVHGKVLTVRFTVRQGIVRIFGAGYWREGRIRYEEEK